MNESKKRKKAKRLLIGIVCVMLFAIGTSVGCNSESKKEEKLLMAEQYFSEQNAEQAQAVYEELIEMDAQYTDAYIGLAKIYIINGSHDLAKDILAQGIEIGMPLDSFDLQETGDTEADKVYIAVLALTAKEATDVQTAIACYMQIDEMTSEYEYTSEQLNSLAKSVLEQEDGVLEVLDFCNKKMLANPELEMDAEISSDILLNVLTDKIKYTEEDYYIVNDWFIANMNHQDTIVKFLEKKMNFSYPIPADTDFGAQADEFIAQYQGDYLIRHFFLTDSGEIKSLNYKGGDYAVYNENGMVLFDSATDIQNWNQDGISNVSFFYDDQNRLIRLENGTKSVCREFVYNDEGQLTKVIDGGNTYVSVKYDGQGRPIEIKEGDWYKTTYSYDDANSIVHIKSVDGWDGTTNERDEDLSLYAQPIQYNIYTYLSQGSTAYSNPINISVLSDGTIVWSDDYDSEFYTPNETIGLSYAPQCFDLNKTLDYNVASDYEIHVEQVTEPAEDCINPHLAGKRYWVEGTEYRIMEVVYDEYGLCDYCRIEKDYYYGEVISLFVIYLKKYNEDGSIYSCPVRINPSEDYYSYDDSMYTNAFSGYCYREYYR